MCGRYTSTSTAEQLAEIYAVDDVRTEPLPQRWNVAPSVAVYAVAARRARANEEPGGPRRQLGTFRWGLVPPWAQDPAVGNRMINARADSLGERPAFRTAFAKRRCLIPADAFYEWQAAPGVPSVPGGPGGWDGAGRAGGRTAGRAGSTAKLPWAVRRRDGQPMAFAGLWEVWRDPSGSGGAAFSDVLRTCAIITTEANRLLAGIHSRMPVVLPRSAWEEWLDPGNDDLVALESLLVPAPEEWFETFIVSSRVNSVHNDGPELLDPAPPPDPGPVVAQAGLFDADQGDHRGGGAAS